MTYCKYEARIAYRIARENIAQDNDNLYPPQRAVLEIHKQLLTLNFCPGLDKGTYIFFEYPILMQNLQYITCLSFVLDFVSPLLLL